MCHFLTLLLEPTIQQQGLLPHTAQQWQRCLIWIGRRSGALHLLRGGGSTEGRLEGEPQLLCGSAQPLRKQHAPDLLHQGLHTLQQLLTASLDVGPLLRSHGRRQAVGI